MEIVNCARPSVFDYTDYRTFLKAMYDFEKSSGSFSYARFAERAGLKARSFLRAVISGKRNLSPDAISKFILGFGLDFAEGESFKSLVHFNQASDFKSKQHYWESFLRVRPKTQERCKVSDEYLYLARMAYPILLILLRQPHTDKSREALAEMTRLKVSEVDEGIRTLLKLGALRESYPGNYVVTSGRRSTPTCWKTRRVP